MFKKIKNRIENKRGRKDVLSKLMVFTKDFIWKTKISLDILSKDKLNPEKVELVNFAVTYKCNSKCKHCNIWKKYHKNPEKVKEELRLDEIKKIFSSKYLKNLESIQFTGGEPFLRDDFVDLFGFFIKKYPKINIGMPTNSVQPELVLKKLERIYKKYNPKSFDLCVSLDGIGKTHENIRGLPGDYERTLKMADEIKKRFPTINLTFGFTIVAKNYKDLLKAYKLSKKKRINFGFWFGQSSDNFYDNKEKDEKEFKWSKEKLNDIEKMIHFIIRDMEKRGKMEFFGRYYFLNMVPFERNSKRKIDCYSGTHSFFLNPYGDVYPCIMLNKSLGNVKNGFDRVWMSKRAKKIRKFIKQKKCSCWTACEIAPSLIKNKKLILKRFLNKKKI